MSHVVFSHLKWQVHHDHDYEIQQFCFSPTCAHLHLHMHLRVLVYNGQLLCLSWQHLECTNGWSEVRSIRYSNGLGQPRVGLNPNGYSNGLIYAQSIKQIPYPTLSNLVYQPDPLQYRVGLYSNSPIPGCIGRPIFLFFSI